MSEKGGKRRARQRMAAIWGIALFAIVTFLLASHWKDLRRTWVQRQLGGTLPAAVQLSIPRDDTLVYGRVELSYHGNESLPEWYYMAIMLVPEDGDAIVDLFGTTDLHPVAEYGALPVRREDIPVLHRESPLNSPEIARFPLDFPEYVDKPFRLTFRRYDGQKYWLWNVPKGRAYIWFQTSFDGYRVTQIPVCVDITPVPGKAVREDLLDIGLVRTFHTI